MQQFVQFMKQDVTDASKSTSMISFLSKRARLMISFSIELLGQYLKIIKNSGAGKSQAVPPG